MWSGRSTPWRLSLPATSALFLDGRAAGPLGAALFAALVRIPLGTAVLEEVAFRGVLPGLVGGGWWRATLVSSGLFGLWHVLPSTAMSANAGVEAALGGWGLAAQAALAVLFTFVGRDRVLRAAPLEWAPGHADARARGHELPGRAHRVVDGLGAHLNPPASRGQTPRESSVSGARVVGFRRASRHVRQVSVAAARERGGRSASASSTSGSRSGGRHSRRVTHAESRGSEG